MKWKILLLLSQLHLQEIKSQQRQGHFSEVIYTNLEWAGDSPSLEDMSDIVDHFPISWELHVEYFFLLFPFSSSFSLPSSSAQIHLTLLSFVQLDTLIICEHLQGRCIWVFVLLPRTSLRDWTVRENSQGKITKVAITNRKKPLLKSEPWIGRHNLFKTLSSDG